jgi:hypothetical protein
MPKRCWLPSKSDLTRYWTVKVRAASVEMVAGFLVPVVAHSAAHHRACQAADGRSDRGAAANLGAAPSLSRVSTSLR